MYLAGKGDGNIRYFEIIDEAPFSYFVSEFKTANPQRGVAWLPKRGCRYCNRLFFYESSCSHVNNRTFLFNYCFNLAPNVSILPDNITVNIADCEIARAYKLHPKGSIEPIGFTVPRKVKTHVSVPINL